MLDSMPAILINEFGETRNPKAKSKDARAHRLQPDQGQRITAAQILYGAGQRGVYQTPDTVIHRSLASEAFAYECATV